MLVGLAHVHRHALCAADPSKKSHHFPTVVPFPQSAVNIPTL